MRIEETTSATKAERVATFERHRGLLRGLAYRMLGSMADADDVVQVTCALSRSRAPLSPEWPALGPRA